MFNKILNTFIDNPVPTSILVADALILLFHKPPFIYSAIMLTALMAICMYLGQKIDLTKQ